MAAPLTSLRICNVVGYVVFISVNVAASRGWLGPTNEKLSKKNHTPITPAGWAFSIWGLIFLLQGLAVLFQALPIGVDDGKKAAIVEAIGYWWLAGWAAESLWQICFQLQTPVGMWICMLCLLAGLASFARALSNLHRLICDAGSIGPTLYSLYMLPTSLNTAWLSVAACIGILIVANVLYLPHTKAAAVCLAAIVTAAGAFMTFARLDAAYGCVLVWAFAAVYAKQERVPVGAAALGCAAISAAGVAYALMASFRGKFRASSGYSSL